MLALLLSAHRDFFGKIDGMAWIVAAALDAPVEASRGWKRAGVG